MIKIDLITGFLGSGKTTFLKKYAQYLIDQGETIGILENDFGAVNVDMMLLQELRSEKCELEMVSACCGNDPATHWRRFKTKLISMGMSGYDRVLIEPSGIFDVDEFFDILHDEPLDRWYEIGNVIAIADAKLEENLSKESDYILATEIADAGCIVLSRSQEASEEEKENTIAHLNRALLQVKCSRNLDPKKDIFCKDWALFTQEDFKRLSGCGCRSENYVKQSYEEDGSFDSLFFMNEKMTEEELRTAVARIFEDQSCGNVFRVKGFVMDKEKGWIELNATRQELHLNRIRDGQEVLIVIGENLKKEAIEERLEKCRKKTI